jgi:hypothetical protein
MKKTYATPTVISSGNVVRETLGPVSSGNEPARLPISAGRIGFFV